MIMFEGLQEATRHELHDCWQCLEKLYMKDGKKEEEEEHREWKRRRRRKTDRIEKESNMQFTAAILVVLNFFTFPFFFFGNKFSHQTACREIIHQCRLKEHQSNFLSDDHYQQTKLRTCRIYFFQVYSFDFFTTFHRTEQRQSFSLISSN